MIDICEQNILECIKYGESETIEFKTSFNDEALECVGALTNARGGTVLIGVSDNGNITGITTGKKTIEDMANLIQNCTDPRLQPHIIELNYNDKTIIAIQAAPTAAGIPVSVRGRYLKRVGKTNQRMSHEEIMHKFIASASKSWDMCAESGSSLKDLDFIKVNNYIDLVRRAGRLPIPAGLSDIDFLRKLELIENEIPTRAALLLFGNKPERCSGSAFIKAGRFKTPTMILDDREFHDTLIEQLNGVMGWFKERLETKFIISGKPQRDVIWEFPLDAIREAVTNAIIHRDYTGLAHSQIRLYSDHLEIWNAGGLLLPLTSESLLQKHNSVLRNRKIAEMFFYAGLIEQWGSGTTRIANELALHEMPPPEFEIDSYTFRILIYKQKAASAQSMALTVRQKKILSILEKNKNGLKAQEMLLQIHEDIAINTLRNDLLALKKINLICNSGRGKYAVWLLTN